MLHLADDVEELGSVDRTEREALERQLKNLQLDCAGHEKLEYEATMKVRDSLQLVERCVREKRSNS